MLDYDYWMLPSFITSVFLSLLTQDRTPRAKLALIDICLPQHASRGCILRQRTVGGHGQDGGDGDGGQGRSTGAHSLDHCCAIVAADNLFFTIKFRSTANTGSQSIRDEGGCGSVSPQGGLDAMWQTREVATECE